MRQIVYINDLKKGLEWQRITRKNMRGRQTFCFLIFRSFVTLITISFDLFYLPPLLFALLHLTHLGLFIIFISLLLFFFVINELPSNSYILCLFVCLFFSLSSLIIKTNRWTREPLFRLSKIKLIMDELSNAFLWKYSLLKTNFRKNLNFIRSSSPQCQ